MLLILDRKLLWVQSNIVGLFQPENKGCSEQCESVHCYNGPNHLLVLTEFMLNNAHCLTPLKARLLALGIKTNTPAIRFGHIMRN